MTQIYRPVPGLENLYSISEYGRVIRTSPQRGTTVGKEIKGGPNKKGYWVVRLTDGVKAKGYFVHRLVAKAWHPNPDNKPQVNHKDTNKLNNHYSNLEWCTNQQNKDHAMANGIVSKCWKGKFGKDHNKSIPIKCTNIDTGESFVIKGINEASRQLKTNGAAIWRVLNGEYKHSKRYYFERV